MEEDIIKKAVGHLTSIKETLNDGVILDYRINNLVNVHTGEDTGIVVALRLSPKFTYEDSLLNEWKVTFEASECVIKCESRQLWVHFKIRPNHTK